MLKTAICVVVVLASIAPAKALAQGVTPTTILLGQPAAFSGSNAGLGIELWRGMKARLQEINDAGGINGRTIDVALCDDKYDPETSAKCAVDLVTQKHVFMLTNTVGTGMMVRLIPLLQAWSADQVFVFGNSTGAQPQRSMPVAPFVFNVRASYEKETAKAVDTCVKAGKTHIGTFVQDDAYGKDGEAGTIAAVKTAKATLTASTSYKRGTGADADMSEAVKILRDAGTDCVSTTGSYAALSAFIRAARSSGWDVPIFGVSHTGADQLIALLQSAHVSTDKLVVTQVVPSPDDTKLALVKEYRAAMDKYKPTTPNGVGDGKYQPATKYSFGSLEGYLDMKLLGVVLAKAGKDLTRASFKAGAESLSDYDVGLGSDKITFGPVSGADTVRNHQALQTVWLTMAKNGVWVPVSDPATLAKQLK